MQSQHWICHLRLRHLDRTEISQCTPNLDRLPMMCIVGEMQTRHKG